MDVLENFGELNYSHISLFHVYLEFASKVTKLTIYDDDDDDEI